MTLVASNAVVDDLFDDNTIRVASFGNLLKCKVDPFVLHFLKLFECKESDVHVQRIKSCALINHKIKIRSSTSGLIQMTISFVKDEVCIKHHANRICHNPKVQEDDVMDHAKLAK
jgi:hypothetical protein